MRDLLSLLDNVLSEKAVIAAPDRFVSAKSMPSPIKNFIQSKVELVYFIFTISSFKKLINIIYC